MYIISIVMLSGIMILMLGGSKFIFDFINEFSKLSKEDKKKCLKQLLVITLSVISIVLVTIFIFLYVKIIVNDALSSFGY